MGSRADSPELAEMEPSQAETPGKGGRGEEESTTVGGGKVPSLGSGTPEEAETGGEEKLKVIPEEAFGVGVEEGKTRW